MADACGRPLVTFHVIAYNQARFVREAVESALAQTYTPMEILVSDDCSTDGTFEIIEDTVRGYSGPHKVILHKNPRNLGVSEHTNRIVERASGELIVAADGDDVSDPRRAERCVEAWLKNGKPAALVAPVYCIDAAGNPSPRDGSRWFTQFLPVENESTTACLLRYSQQGSPRLISCSAAWTKEMFAAFGPMPGDVWFEDDVITLRAWLFDRIVFMHEALVWYREHDSNIVNRVRPTAKTVQARKEAEEATSTEARRRRISLLGFMPDLDVAVRQQWIARPLYEELKQHIETRCGFFRITEDWWNVGWTKRVAWFCSIVRSRRTSEVRWCCARLLPLPLFLALGAGWSRARTIAHLLWSAAVMSETLRLDALGALCGP